MTDSITHRGPDDSGTWFSQDHRDAYGNTLGIALGFTTPVLGGVFMSAMIGLHEVALTVLPMLLLTHFAGALWHKVVRRDGVLESMTGRLPV